MMTTSSSLVLFLKALRERSGRRSFVDHCRVAITSRGTFWEGMIGFK
jgi:hypothetical protein